MKTETCLTLNFAEPLPPTVFEKSLPQSHGHGCVHSRFSATPTPTVFWCKMLFGAVGLPLLLNPESVGKEALSVVKYVVFVFFWL